MSRLSLWKSLPFCSLVFSPGAWFRLFRALVVFENDYELNSTTIMNCRGYIPLMILSAKSLVINNSRLTPGSCLAVSLASLVVRVVVLELILVLIVIFKLVL